MLPISHNTSKCSQNVGFIWQMKVFVRIVYYAQWIFSLVLVVSSYDRTGKVFGGVIPSVEQLCHSQLVYCGRSTCRQSVPFHSDLFLPFTLVYTDVKAMLTESSHLLMSLCNLKGFRVQCTDAAASGTLVPTREWGHRKTKCNTPHPRKHDAHAHNNIPTPCCSNSWVRKVQLNYVNAEMNVLCCMSRGDTFRDCSDISCSELMHRISLDDLNAGKTN